ncbi:MAG: putative FMN/FAD exporter YeeO [candidate division WS2 bacterium]|uniref:Probable multidrug resistance protein NorM n=1 Tax=Psychracetigena formicireducens TaxID=2986056 RepID=A0A9E2BG32_PSYF1|nr:putative FMN/FAD exporter YeeO [Candidatus Psychracetigena formicireducens]MBT9144857.1 putative FMN/FAD exporter YeeO [Candidatus Psychracetigena formicireducens]
MLRNFIYGNNAEKISLRKEIFKVALPVVGEQFSLSIYMLVNTAIIGTLGPLYLSAVGLCHQILMTIGAILAFLVVGTTVLISHKVGARDYDGAREVINNSLILAVIAGTILSLSAWFYPEKFFIFFEMEEALIKETSTYIKYAMAPGIFFVLALIVPAIFRGYGDTRTPFFLSLIFVLINIGLDLILITGKLGFPAMGVKGAALAFAITRILMAISYLVLLFFQKRKIQPKIGFRPLNLKSVLALFKLGIPASMEQILFATGLLVFSGMVLTLGTKTFAAHRIALNIESISFVIGWGFAMAATVLVGQCRGRLNDKRAFEIAIEILKLGAVLMGAIGLLLFIFSKPMVMLFTNDIEVILASTKVLQIIAIMQIFLATHFIMAGSLRGAGDTRFPMFTASVGAWLIRIPITYLLVFVYEWGLIGAWIAMSADILFKAILNFLRFYSKVWGKIKV